MPLLNSIGLIIPINATNNSVSTTALHILSISLCTPEECHVPMIDDMKAASLTLKNSIRSQDGASSKPRGNSIDRHLRVHTGYSRDMAITCDPSEIGFPCFQVESKRVQLLIFSLRKHFTRQQDTKKQHLFLNKQPLND